MDFSCVFELDIDKQSHVGEAKYEFMAEYHSGPFVLVPFCRQSTSGGEECTSAENIQLIIYEGGDIIGMRNRLSHLTRSLIFGSFDFVINRSNTRPSVQTETMD